MDTPNHTPNPGRRAAFLDRDGVLNRKMPEGHYVTTPEEFELLPGAIPGLQMLAARGYLLIVVTNQRGVARGAFTLDDLAAIHRKLESLLAGNGVALAAIYFCPHGKGECDCRKPEPGMLRRAFESFPDLAIGESVLFGDSDSDVEAACRAGVPAVRMPANGSLEEAVRTWLSKDAASSDHA
jgi:D-glycero-D-manno-heptose 1,7-bisphosphate phosphatase